MNNKAKKGIIAVAATATVAAVSIVGVKTHNDIEMKNEKIKTLEQNKIKTLEEINELNELLKQKEVDLDNKTREIEGKNEYIEKSIEENNKLRERIKGLEKELAKTKNFELTYYTDLPIENGGYTTTAIQTELRHGVVASNYYPIGTKIEINGKVFTVEDRGGSEFNSPHRLDVLIERKSGESDDDYYERVNNMGRKKVVGKLL